SRSAAVAHAPWVWRQSPPASTSPSFSFAGNASCSRSQMSTDSDRCTPSRITSEVLSQYPPSVEPQRGALTRQHSPFLRSPIRIESGTPLALVVQTRLL